ncbi:MAG TPA: hypothetical protein VIT92_15505 [Burkholderiaceae bacterium]
MKIDGSNNPYLQTALPDLTAEAKRGAEASGAAASGAAEQAAPVAAESAQPSAIVRQSGDAAAALMLYDRLAQLPKPPAATASSQPDLTPDGAADLLKNVLAGLAPMAADGKLESLISQPWLQSLATEA